MKLISTRFNGVYYRDSLNRLHNGKPDRCFYIKYYRNKKQVQEQVGWLSSGYSPQIAAKIRVERMDSPQVKVQDITFGEAFELFMEWAKLNKKTWETDIMRYSKHIKPVFESCLLKDISSNDINSFMLMFKQKKKNDGSLYAPQTVKHLYNLIRRIYNYVNKLGKYKGENPANVVELERFDNSRQSYLTDDEISRLLKVCDTPNLLWPGDSAIIKFSLFTGLRRGELFALKWADIDINKRIITLYDTKGKKNQTILISDMAVSVLKNLTKTDELVFPSRFGGKRNNVVKLWRRIKKLANIRDNIVFHDIRHTFGTKGISNGIPLDVLQKMMTHKDIKTTQRYAHIVDKRLKEGAEAINAAFKSLDPSK